MAGLLYKDFASVKWKLIAVIVVILTVVLLAIRIAAAIVTNMGATGDTIILFQLFPAVYLPCMYLMFAYYINSFPAKIIEDEKKNKINDYLGSLPVSDNTYVLSKYLFVLILVYVAFSCETVWNIIIMSFSDSTNEIISAASDFITVMTNISFPLAVFCITMAAIELPMIFILGTARMQAIKNVGVEFLGVAVFAVLLFVDLEWFDEHFSIEAIAAWMEKYEFEIMVAEVVSIFCVLGFFYLSYRLTCKLVNKHKYKILNAPASEAFDAIKEVA